MAILGWGFFYFIFLKIYCSFVFYESISLVAALVAAIVISAIELLPSIFFQAALAESFSNRLTNQEGRLALSRLWLSYIAAVPFMVAAFILISIGFSEKFYKREIAGSYRDFLSLDWEAVIIVAIGITLMTLPQIIMTHVGLRSISKGNDIV